MAGRERCPGNCTFSLLGVKGGVKEGGIHCKSLSPPSPPASPVAAGVRPRVSSPACARSGDGTHYRWEMTPGSQGPGLAGAAGKSAFLCPFKKARGAWASPLGRRVWKEAPGLPDRRLGSVAEPHGARRVSWGPKPWGGGGSLRTTSSASKLLGLQECLPAATGVRTKPRPAPGHAILACWGSGKGPESGAPLTSSSPWQSLSACPGAAFVSSRLPQERELERAESPAPAPRSCFCPWGDDIVLPCSADRSCRARPIDLA